MTERRPSSSARSARPATRPGQRGARPRPTPPARQPGGDSAARPRLTGRAAILILVLAVLTVSYASSLRAYLQQRAQIQDLKAQIATTSASIDDLELEKRRWKDDAYLEQQARARFGFVFPGETPYQVIEDGQPLDSSETLHDPSTIVKTTPTPWWDTVWGSVELAGNPPAPKPPPASSITLPDEDSAQ
jgi:cell division protein FtsB